MVKPRSMQRGRDARPGSPATQRNPAPAQPWLTKKELLKLYQDRGLLSPPIDPNSPAGAVPSGPGPGSGQGQGQGGEDYSLGGDSSDRSWLWCDASEAASAEGGRACDHCRRASSQSITTIGKTQAAGLGLGCWLGLGHLQVATRAVLSGIEVSVKGWI
eukprot:3339599-Rhodomonas_salina.1